MDKQLDLLQGTLDMLILQTLLLGPIHGRAIARRIQQTTDDVLQIEDGALYPALHRMEYRGLIDADWDLTENKRRAKYYRLTTKGRQQLRERVSSWDRYSTAVSKVIHATVQPSVS